ncbi:Centrosome-associated protein 350 [Vulpes lagopus]
MVNWQDEEQQIKRGAFTKSKELSKQGYCSRLRHIENKLEVAPTSTAVFDSVMDTKKSSASATRKISRKDGRYLDDSWVNAPTSKSSKSRKEKSRSPLRVTTLESNVKKK